MKKYFLLIVFIGITGCSSFPLKNVDRLNTPNGNGALAIMTTFISEGGYHEGCNSFSFDMYEKLDDSTLALNPTMLSFYTDVNKGYILFDGITPGSYLIKSIRCYPQYGYVFEDETSYIEMKVRSEQVIVPNKLTLSSEAFSGMVNSDDSFQFNFSTSDNNSEFLKLIIDNESKIGWSFY